MNLLNAGLRASIASCRKAVVTRLALVGIALLCCTGSAFAGVGVNIDGNLQDMIDYAGTISTPGEGCAFTDQDPQKDVRIFDPKIIPCVPIVDNYYVNGFDQILDVLAYDRTAQTLYLGIRVAGVIGDPDGNGNPDTKCPEATFDDEVGVGFDDSYKWEINADCAGPPEITIELRNNTLTINGAAFTSQDDAFNGSDLEVAVGGIVLPPAYNVRIFTGNIADGLGEDIHELNCAPPGPQIVVDKSANPLRICPGQNTTFTVVVNNPGVTPLQTVTLVDDLPAGLTYVNGSSNSNCGLGQPNVVGQQITWPNFALAAGASCTITFQATAGAQCLGPQNTVATATGSFSTPCFQGGEPQTVQDSDDATVTCAAPPCVDITAMSAPETACTNDPITITGTVQNCSTESETISVTLNGGAPQNLGTVAAGATANFSFQTTMPTCTAGQVIPFTVVATATNECGTDTDTEVRNVTCGQGPCVQLSLDAPDAACVGEQIEVVATVTNCGGSAANITVVVNGQNFNFGSVAGGASDSHTFVFTVANCVDGGVNYSGTATATNACGTATATDSERVLCQTPQIDVEKTAESAVANGATIHYVITVTNPGPVALENVTVTDQLCPYVRYANSAVPTPQSEPAVGSGGSVVWNIAALAVNQTVQLTFNATADVAFGGGQCPTTVTCTNHVVATGYCAGTGTSGTPARDEDDFPTTITCAGNNCPRTVGYWGVQCRQMPNGSTKYTKAQMTQIAECADDLSSFFNWSAGTDFDRACDIINPTKPMTQRKQAKRQFMGTLFNLCVTSLDLDPLRGGKVKLDPATPISCPPFTSDTIGELIDEVSALLTQLEGQDLNSESVKQAYGAIISCFDGINNGVNIPVSSDCDEEATPTSDLGDGLGMSETPGSAVELYRATPNPFHASTAFAYEVSGDGAQVDIAVYDVAGKMVRKVVSGVQAAGRHTATWDGRSDEGVRVIRGVYFVRTTISGAQANLQRVIFVQ